MILRKFAVTNYKGFKNTVELDLTKVRNYNFNRQSIINDTVKTGIIVGRNGQGKTNMGFALFDIVLTLTDNQVDIIQNDPNLFINGDSDEDFSTFQYTFHDGKKTIEYEYRKKAPKVIIYESLKVGNNIIFERSDAPRYEGLASVGASNIRLDGLKEDLSLLRYIANNTIQDDGSPIREVMDFVNHMLYFRSLQENSYIGLLRGGENLDQYLIQNDLIDEFQSFMKE